MLPLKITILNTRERKMVKVLAEIKKASRYLISKVREIARRQIYNWN